jgi:diaminopimelate epimerase
MKFTKMHGLGNDYIMVNDLEEKVKDKPGFAKKYCQRGFSIGADGVIFVCQGKTHPLKFRIFNPDGSEAEMCGNGMRCFAKFVYERGFVKEKAFDVETMAGGISPEVTVENGKVVSVTVDMGSPILERARIPMSGPKGRALMEDLKVGAKTLKVSAVSMGNPHAVFFVNDLSKVDIPKIGPLIEHHKKFPKRTNVEFIQVVSDRDVIMHVWERGAGETLACGTGACGSIVIASLLGKVKRNEWVTIHLKGGDLKVKVDYEGENPVQVWLKGPAEEVFEGVIK